ncbi:TPA: restriction endonuclease subunit S [Clostridioides difficile]|nr:restriction endonuclease subunit S [Clostridioides difficile]
MENVPKLRFPEFTEKWLISELKDLGKYKKSYSFSRSLEGIGNYKHIHYGDIHMKYNGIVGKKQYIPSINIPHKENYVFLAFNDIIFADASEDRKDLGKVAIIQDNDNNILSGLHTICFKPKEEILNSIFFLNHTYNSSYSRYIYEKATGVSVFGISKYNLGEYKLYLPSYKEQEKIASFFTLIDKKVEKQSEKVELLKDYKKGVMQKVFSQQIRFFGFDCEWRKMKLGEVCNISMGQSPSSTFYNNKGIGTPLIQGNTDIKNRKTCPRIYTSEVTKVCYKGDLLMSVRAPVGTMSKAMHDVCIGRGICGIKVKINTEYIYQLLLEYENKWNRLKQGSTFESINRNDIMNLFIKVPSLKEQEKIASFLSLIDKKIEREEEKLELLNQYKKGLLQQMFV